MSRSIFSKKFLAGGMLAATLALAGCGSDSDGEALLRVVHASKDAPPVNIRVDRDTVVRALDYAHSSGFVDADSGIVDIVVEAIIPGGNADVITVSGITLENNERYSVMAVGDTAAIEALLVAETAASPAAGEVALAVVHASTMAPAVDVYITAPGAMLNGTAPSFTVDFKDQIDVGAVPAGTYQIRIALAGEADPDANAVYDSGAVDLSPFSGERLLVAAISSVTDTESSASPVKLLVATDSAQVELLDTETHFGARVVHLSPNATAAAAGAVEVFATSDVLPGTVELIPTFNYEDIVPAADSYVELEPGSYVFDVNPDNDSNADTLYTSPSLPLMMGHEYTVIAAGLVGGAPAFDLLSTVDENRPVVTQASVKIVHGSPAAGLVDVYVTPEGTVSTADILAGNGGTPLLDDFAFGDITPYVALAPGKYDIRVIAAGPVAAIDIAGFEVTAGLVATVIAKETDSTVGGAPAPFGVVVLTN